MDYSDAPIVTQSVWPYRLKWVGAIVVIVLLIFVTRFSPPQNFPKELLLSVPNGTSLNEVITDLAEANVIRSPFWFRVVILTLGAEDNILSGDYYFHEPEGLVTVANRLLSADYQLQTVKVTIPEGYAVTEIADLLAKNLLGFNKKEFLKLAKAKEGYLFPDTYFIEMNATSSKIIKQLTDNFDRRMLELQSDIVKSKHSLSDIIKMASIIEEEGRQTETRKLISGILWNRIKIGMALQVDSSFKYINGETSATLSLADLEIESPYNSYLHTGLPPTPICNPGLDSILAAVYPTPTKYFYFLTDKNGNMHYAITHDEHVLNKDKYLP